MRSINLEGPQPIGWPHWTGLCCKKIQATQFDCYCMLFLYILISFIYIYIISKVSIDSSYVSELPASGFPSRSRRTVSGAKQMLRFRGTPILNFFYNRLLDASCFVFAMNLYFAVGLREILDPPGLSMLSWGCGAHITYSTELHTSNLTDPDLIRIHGGAQSFMWQCYSLYQFVSFRIHLLSDCVIDRACNIQPSLITAKKNGLLGQWGAVGPLCPLR